MPINLNANNNVNPRDTLDWGSSKWSSKEAKHRSRLNSLRHCVYPPSTTKGAKLYYWEGIRMMIEQYRLSCTTNPLKKGKTHVFHGASGSGKSSAVDALLVGHTAFQPSRSIRIRFNTYQDLASESKTLDALMKDLGIEGSQIPLSKFLLDSVTLPLKKGVAKVGVFKGWFSRTLDKWIGQCSGFCCGGESGHGEEEDENYIMDDTALNEQAVVGLPSEYSASNVQFEGLPVIVVDDIKSFADGGPIYNFLHQLVHSGFDRSVCLFFITQDIDVAYHLWSLNSGFKAVPVLGLSADVEGVRIGQDNFDSDWPIWSAAEKRLSEDQKEAYKKRKGVLQVPRVLFTAFENAFSSAQYAELFRAGYPDENSRQDSEDAIIKVVAKKWSLGEAFAAVMNLPSGFAVVGDSSH